MSNELFLLRVALAFPLLGFASYQDWLKREIDDWVWLILGLGGASITSFELASRGGGALYLTAASVIIASLFGYLFYRIGFMGGADAKAFTALALTFPYYPSNSFLHPSLPTYPMFAMTIIDNSILFTVLTSIFYLLRNLPSLLKGEETFPLNTPLWKKVVMATTAARMDVKGTDWNKNFPLERVDYSRDPPTPILELSTNVHREVDEEALIKAVEEGLLPGKIWASPGVPMIIFITIGLLFSLLYGDIILQMIFSLMA